MISSIDVGDAARYVASKIADEARGHYTHVSDSDELPLLRSRASPVDQIIDVIDPRADSSL
jgi:hypothetical protein